MKRVLATISVATLAALALPGVASAKGGGGVTVKGKCISPSSNASTSKLKAKTDNGSIETEFEVDQNVAGDTWKVTITDNGTVVARANKTTAAPSGSFVMRARISNRAGTDTVSAEAKNLSTGETCSATASL
jgi:hypothetical protein